MSSTPPNKRPDVLIGGGAGVSLVVIADWVQNETARQAILYAAPFASIVIGSAITWIRNFGTREMQIRYKLWDLKRVKRHLALITSDPAHPAAFKKDAQSRVRDLEMQILTLMMQDVDVKETKKGA